MPIPSKFPITHNLVPRVLRLLGHQVVAMRDSGDNEPVTAGILLLTVYSFVTVNSQSKNLFFFIDTVFPGNHPLTKKPEDSGYEIE